MTNEQQDKLVDKLRKLKAKADDPNISEAEAALYAAKVAELLQQHNLSEAMLSAEEQESVVEERVESSKAHDPWANQMAMAVARLYFCSLLLIKVGSQKTNFIFVGKPHNIEVAKSMTLYLIKTIGRLAVTYANSNEAIMSDPNWSFTRARNGFERGAGERMRRRLNGMYADQTASKPQRAASGNPSNLPALYEDELGLTKAFIAAMANVRAGRGRGSNTSGDHAARGFAAAGNISLNTQVGGTSTKMLK